MLCAGGLESCCVGDDRGGSSALKWLGKLLVVNGCEVLSAALRGVCISVCVG